MESIDIDTRVTRVTEDKGRCVMVLRELEVGDEFTHRGKRYRLNIKPIAFSACATGDRVRYSGSWYFVLRHGLENVLLPLVPSDSPFGNQKGSNSHAFPFPYNRVELFGFEELVDESVPA